jgi:tRNA A-37 threonylcarbamoyl transferase component Bud32
MSDTKEIENLGDFFKNAPPPDGWQDGLYPAVDDIRSWVHLFHIWLNSNDRDKKPVIPEIVCRFMLVMSDILWVYQMHGHDNFVSYYDTDDVFKVASLKWIDFLRTAVRDGGGELLRKEFPKRTKPFVTNVEELVQWWNRTLVAKKENKRLVIADPRGPDAAAAASATMVEDLSVSKTYVEALEDTGSIRTNQIVDSLENFKNIQSARLPDVDKNTVLGSGYTRGIIGQGGTARIYLIKNEQLEVLRAVKVILLHLFCQTPEQFASMKKRFEMEAKITAQLRHANIVDTYAYGEFMGLPYIEMEYIEGFDLKEFLRNKGALPFELATAISISGVRALAYAHKKVCSIYGEHYSGVMHRDIKPHNFLISKEGIVKLSDFGLARPTEVSISTLVDNTIGTLSYMSPEQFQTNNVDKRTDIYSIGATMYEMVTGRQAFPQTNLNDLLTARHENAYADIAKYRRNTPKDLVYMINKCLSINPDDRYTTANELLESLLAMHYKLTKEPPEQIIQEYIVNQKAFGGMMNTPERKARRRFIGKLLGK